MTKDEFIKLLPNNEEMASKLSTPTLLAMYKWVQAQPDSVIEEIEEEYPIQFGNYDYHLREERVNDVLDLDYENTKKAMELRGEVAQDQLRDKMQTGEYLDDPNLSLAEKASYVLSPEQTRRQVLEGKEPNMIMQGLEGATILPRALGYLINKAIGEDETAENVLYRGTPRRLLPEEGDTWSDKLGKSLQLGAVQGIGDPMTYGLAALTGGPMGQVAKSAGGQVLKNFFNPMGYAKNYITTKTALGNVAQSLAIPAETMVKANLANFGLEKLAGQGHEQSLGDVISNLDVTLPQAYFGAVAGTPISSMLPKLQKWGAMPKNEYATHFKMTDDLGADASRLVNTQPYRPARGTKLNTDAARWLFNNKLGETFGSLDMPTMRTLYREAERNNLAPLEAKMVEDPASVANTYDDAYSRILTNLAMDKKYYGEQIGNLTSILPKKHPTEAPTILTKDLLAAISEELNAPQSGLEQNALYGGQLTPRGWMPTRYSESRTPHMQTINDLLMDQSRKVGFRLNSPDLEVIRRHNALKLKDLDEEDVINQKNIVRGVVEDLQAQLLNKQFGGTKFNPLTLEESEQGQPVTQILGEAKKGYEGYKKQAKALRTYKNMPALLRGVTGEESGGGLDAQAINLIERLPKDQREEIEALNVLQNLDRASGTRGKSAGWHLQTIFANLAGGESSTTKQAQTAKAVRRATEKGIGGKKRTAKIASPISGALASVGNLTYQRKLKDGRKVYLGADGVEYTDDPNTKEMKPLFQSLFTPYRGQ